MSNYTFKIQPSKTPLDASFLYEPDKGPDQSFLNLNIQPSMSQQSFHGNSSPPPQTPQNLNASFYPLNSVQYQNSFMANTPLNVPLQTPAMAPIQSPRTPMVNLAGDTKSPRANITLYNSRMNIDSNLINIKSPSYYFNNDNQNVIPSSDAHIQPVLQNIVSTANFGCELCLREIALRAKNAEYNPKRFAAVIMRIKEPKTTALIFSSGKMVCTGAKNEDDSKKASRKYAKIIRSLGFPVEFKEFKVQNIVGSCDIKFQIHLNKLNGILGKLQSKDKEKDNDKNKQGKYICQYEPEIFPGLIYHMSQPEIVLLIFVSGKIVLTGAKKKDEIFKAFTKILPLLKKCRNENKDNKSNKSLHKQEVEEKKLITQTKDETKENE